MGGGGRRGGGAPTSLTFAGLELHTHFSALAGEEEFLRSTLSPTKAIPGRLALTEKSWGALALALLHASAAAAGPSQLPRLPLEPPGESGSWVEPTPCSGRRARPRGSPPAAPAGRRTHSVLDARSNNTESRRRRRPPPAPSPRAPLHNRALGPAPEAGGIAGLSPPNLPSFPPGAVPRGSESSNLRFSLSSSAPTA